MTTTNSTHHKLLKIIINADDFGLTDSVNLAIRESFRRGIISSATLMANMPKFNQACAIGLADGFAQSLGLHFNLTYGPALSEPIKSNYQLYNSTDNTFNFKLKKQTLFISQKTINDISIELEAQWNACLAQGITPSHIDSHQHTHNILPIAKIVAAFAIKKNVPVRLARNRGANINWLKRIFKQWLNHHLAKPSQHLVKGACTPYDLKSYTPSAGIIEIITHPCLLDNRQIGDSYLPESIALDDWFKQNLPESYEMINYRQLQK